MAMNYTMTMRFIQLMRINPGLWDSRCDDYRNKDVRHQLRCQVSKEMGLSAEEVGKKIQNLRTYFVKECQKQEKAFMEGHHYEPRWPYFKPLSLLWHDTLSSKFDDTENGHAVYMDDSNSNEQNVQQADPADGDSGNGRFVLDDPDFEGDTWREGADDPPRSPSVKRIKTEIPSPSLTDSTVTGTVSSATITCGQDVTVETRGQCPGQIVTPVPRPLLTPGSCRGSQCSTSVRQTVGVMEEDEETLFGRYIAKEIRLITSFRKRQLTKLKIQQLVTYAQLDMDQSDCVEAESVSVSHTCTKPPL